MKIRALETPFLGSTLYIPNDEESHPGVIVLHGSDGGLYAYWRLLAQFLCAHGYAALAYCYFGGQDRLAGPREILANIELSKTYEALKWLKALKFVGGKKTAIVGASRGAEHALLLASLLADEKGAQLPDAIAVHSPSDKIIPSWSWDWNDDRCWLLDSKTGEKIWNADACGPDPMKLPEDLKNAWQWNGSPLASGTRIEVEKFPGPYFITHGLADEVWPAAQTQKIEEALKNAKVPHEVHYFEKEGHRFSLDAQNQSNALLLEFLSKHLAD